VSEKGAISEIAEFKIRRRRMKLHQNYIKITYKKNEVRRIINEIKMRYGTGNAQK